MGQSSSVQRDHRHRTSPNFRQQSQADSDHRTRDEEMSGRPEQQNINPGLPVAEGSNNQGLEPMQPVPTSPGWPNTSQMEGQAASSSQMNSIPEGTENEPERHRLDYRPLTFAPIAGRRQSTMSRLGSRILPNSVIRGLLSSEEETPAEGDAHRYGIVYRTLPRSETGHSSGRFSPFGTLSSRGTRRRSIRIPNLRSDTAPNTDSTANPSFSDAAAPQTRDNGRGPWRRNVRLSRMRDSLATPISQIFGQSPSSTSDQGSPGRLSYPSEDGQSDNVDHFPSLPPATDTPMDFEESPHEPDSIEPSVGNAQSPMPAPGPQTGHGGAGVRRLPDFLGPRSTTVWRREEQTPLTRVLQLAAAAIAAQLSGSGGPGLPNIQPLGNEGLEGSLENFIQTLQQVTSVSPSPTMSGDSSNASGDVPIPPVNILRVFRFASTESPGRTGRATRPAGEVDELARQQRDGMDTDSSTEAPEGRMFTLVVVGVRSVPSGGGSGHEQADAGHGLDALLRLPFPSPNNPSRNTDGGDGVGSRVDGRTRLASARPFSGNSNGGNQDTHRRSGILPAFGRSLETAQNVSSPLPTVLSESPPGPNPPPSTPAESGLSRVPSGTSTPNRRLSSASVMSSSALPHLLEGRSLQPTVENAEDSASVSVPRQRRRSDSEFARHRELGSGATRRNGVVEPDHPTPAAGRSWLIYVVGTNLSENHPAFATPSLFTDNPTYEDMILLSSLLGPAKPPVASEADISAAGGLFELVEFDGLLIAKALGGSEAISIPEGERCLVCLSDYEAGEELRQLARCKHIYHSQCIDQWLLTGRNSCPLCRGQGVRETSNNETPAEDAG